jgi:hypothetical protein
MKLHAWLGAAVVLLVAGERGSGGEPSSCPPPQENLLQRFHPVGGWNPDGGGLLHWWNPHCFSRCGAPDYYCRKPLPCVCWPHYPPYYIWGPPQNASPGDCTRPH